jgi:hypothetical protein
MTPETIAAAKALFAKHPMPWVYDPFDDGLEYGDFVDAKGNLVLFDVSKNNAVSALINALAREPEIQNAE